MTGAGRRGHPTRVPDGSDSNRGSGPGSGPSPGPEPEGLPARRAALAALKEIDEDGAWSNLAVPRAIATLVEARDRAFAAHLAYDTVRWDGTLRFALGHVLTRPLEDVEPALRRVLLLGACQLLRSGVPARAAVATSVSLAREQVPAKRATGAAGFVNGVLRALDRRRDEVPWPDPATDPVAALALETGHAAWVVEDLLARFDTDRVRAILDADNAPPGVTLRAVGDPAAVRAELEAAGVEVSPGALPMALRTPGADPRQLAAVAEGRVVPQDEASMRVVLATGAGPGDHALDLCAGPGGKATFLATLVGPTGKVTGVELHPHRAQMVRDAAARQGVEVEVHVGDAGEPPLPPDTRFDVVLVDAPCTGLGTGRRRPEVRWRRTPADVAELTAIQARLLRAAAVRVAAGGTLTYAVCTWTAAETDGVVDAFADEAAALGFEPVERLQLLPDRDDTDGMFIATWRRAGAEAGAERPAGGG